MPSSSVLAFSRESGRRAEIFPKRCFPRGSFDKFSGEFRKADPDPVLHPASFSTRPRTFSPRSPLYFLEIASFPPGMCVIFLIIRAQRNHNKNTEKTAGEQEKSTRAGKCRSRGTDFSKEATVPTASATNLLIHLLLLLHLSFTRA